eukprot:1722356-Alexandrium_andersonii.AAC.1
MFGISLLPDALSHLRNSGGDTKGANARRFASGPGQLPLRQCSCVESPARGAERTAVLAQARAHIPLRR